MNQQHMRVYASPYITETDIEKVMVVKARQKNDLRCSNSDYYQGRIFNGIRMVPELGCRKQQYEATDMCKK